MMRTVPLTLEQITLDPKQVIAMCDENTICVVPIQGVVSSSIVSSIPPLLSF